MFFLWLSLWIPFSSFLPSWSLCKLHSQLWDLRAAVSSAGEDLA